MRSYNLQEVNWSFAATVAMMGLVFLLTQAGRPMEWATLLKDTVVKLIASKSTCLACPWHKTSRTHGVVSIVISSPKNQHSIGPSNKSSPQIANSQCCIDVPMHL